MKLGLAVQRRTKGNRKKMKESSVRVIKFMKLLASEISNDKCGQISAALAYYAVFSLAPLLALVVAVVGFFVDSTNFETRLTAELASVMGREAARQIEFMLSRVSRPNVTDWEGIIGVLMFIVGATGLLVQLQDGLNQAWGVKLQTKRNFISNFAVKRMISFSMILALSFLLLISFVSSTVLSAFAERIDATTPLWLTEHMLMFLSFAIGFVPTTILFSLMYKYLPDTTIKWRETLWGAAFAALCFDLGKTVLAFYIGQKDVGSSFGTAASLVVVLIWVYYTSFTFLVGAEISQLLSRNSKGVPQ